MAEFQNERIHPHLIKIYCPGGVFAYLAEGSERAVLIDTGCGLGDLKGYVDALTDKPYIVLLTHGHVDHASGASQFETVYLSELDYALNATRTTKEARTGFLEGNGVTVDPAELVEQKLDGFLPLKADEVFDLGGLHIRACPFPGHTPGSMAMLMIEDRVMLLGDACNSFTFLQLDCCPPLSEYRETVKEFSAKYLDKMDTVLFSHGHNHGTPEMLAEAVEVCDAVLSGKEPGIALPIPALRGGKVAMPINGDMSRKDGKTFNMVYREYNRK